MPGQNLRISVEDAARFLSQAYENDFEVSILIFCFSCLFLPIAYVQNTIMLS